MTAAGKAPLPRERIAQGFTLVEDVVYVGLGVLLAGAALVLLASLVLFFGRGLLAGTVSGNIISVLDQILLILLVVELLYTVQLSFREHVLIPEPFVLVALIASVRRVLVLSTELPKVVELGGAQFQNAMIELGVLTAMTLALVGCLVMLRKRHSGGGRRAGLSSSGATSTSVGRIESRTSGPEPARTGITRELLGQEDPIRP